MQTSTEGTLGWMHAVCAKGKRGKGTRRRRREEEEEEREEEDEEQEERYKVQ